MITLSSVRHADLASLAGLRQHPGQYANDGIDMIEDDTPGLSFHAIRADGELVGMFKLDPRYAERHRFAEPTDLGLRGVLIDRARQGRGLGTQAMCALPGYAAALYPGMRRLVLTVNLMNPAGYRVYRHAGFRDVGGIYAGGSRGPQHILWADLPLAEPAEARCSVDSSSPLPG
ncbi:Acetyltransferase (GNAT) family protein [Paracoccus isoporae]|uniref:Acetyltransferase (GNAT) family protein n=1 Tax=Paracoccus isoporae TaxID=591205 RepID=A0A1G7ALW9_9RHOB|nr:GNAT family protein [Paracoccus isoporae]SDE15710.1 Acetyltransferase (GNAT) family protein [Paracoccus isoporae]